MRVLRDYILVVIFFVVLARLMQLSTGKSTIDKLNYQNFEVKSYGRSENKRYLQCKRHLLVFDIITNTILNRTLTCFEKQHNHEPIPLKMKQPVLKP